ncbi:MAG TPA: tetratricopeptide repeat protein [Sulfuricella sp.]|nr:tetratricopeptide repeat protein [Sulfuricella sp.]
MSRFRIATTLTILSCALFMALAQPVYADELQEINKLYKQGQSDKALERIDSYLSSRPKDAQGPKIAQGRFLKGLILTELGKSAEAIQAFTRLTEEYPELPEPYNNLAVLYAAQGQYDKARRALEMAINTHPSYATAHENLGDIYAKMASQAYDKALQLDKSSVTAQTKLALVKELFSATSKANRAPAPSRVEPPAKPAPAPAKPEPAKPETAKSTPEAKPAPEARHAPAPAEHGKSDTQAAVLKTLHGWANAWSGKNVSAYLSYYAKDFKIPGGESRASWEKTRKERISRPKSIHVSIESPRVSLIDAGHASITFRQAYKSDALSTSTQKTVVLVKTGDKWLIQQERIGR